MSVSQRGAHAGVTIAWIFLGAGWPLFFLLFLRSRYLPGAVAGLGIVGAVLLMAASSVMFVYPELTDGLKLFALPGLLAEIATAFWLPFKGLGPRARGEARDSRESGS